MTPMKEIIEIGQCPGVAAGVSGFAMERTPAPPTLHHWTSSEARLGPGTNFLQVGVGAGRRPQIGEAESQ